MLLFIPPFWIKWVNEQECCIFARQPWRYCYRASSVYGSQRGKLPRNRRVERSSRAATMLHCCCWCLKTSCSRYLCLLPLVSLILRDLNQRLGVRMCGTLVPTLCRSCRLILQISTLSGSLCESVRKFGRVCMFDAIQRNHNDLSICKYVAVWILAIYSFSVSECVYCLSP